MAELAADRNKEMRLNAPAHLAAFIALKLKALDVTVAEPDPKRNLSKLSIEQLTTLRELARLPEAETPAPE
jgi:hypothetical protein